METSQGISGITSIGYARSQKIEKPNILKAFRNKKPKCLYSYNGNQPREFIFQYKIETRI
jgi:hypothetical protein